jgi:hypothetical protein
MRYWYLFCAVLLWACNDKPADVSKVKDEMADRQILRVTPGQLSALVYKKGAKFSQIVENLLNAQLLTAIDGSICNERNIAQLDTLQKKYMVKIERHSIEESKKNQAEWSIVDAYLYNTENKLALEDNIQRLGDTAYLFTRPIVLKQKECLRCHGDQKSDDLPIDLSHKKANEFIGVWSIVFNKKELIKSLQLKELKAL